MISRAQMPRVTWTVEDGWVVHTPVTLSRSQLEAVVRYVFRVQFPRAKATRGDKREQMFAALRALSPATLRQHLLPESGFSGGERVLYTQPNRS